MPLLAATPLQATEAASLLIRSSDLPPEHGYKEANFLQNHHFLDHHIPINL